MSDATEKGASSCYMGVLTRDPVSTRDDDCPKRTKDGKLIVGYDEENWEPIIMDQSQWMFGALSGDPIPLPFFELNNQANGPPDASVPAATPLNWEQEEPPPPKQGLVGLANLGNTCFINSGLQCLLNNSRLVKFVLEDYRNCSENQDSLCDRFVELVREAWSSHRKQQSISCQKFKESLGQRFEQFKDFRQHDCQEFLALLLSALHDQLRDETHVRVVEDNPASSPKSNASSPSSASSSSSSDINSNEDEIRRQPIPEGIQSFNNIIPLLVKETKTLNTNVSKIDDEKNNKLNFNSFKYPRTRRKEHVVHENMLDNLRGESFVSDGSDGILKGSKRLKQTNVTKEMLLESEPSSSSAGISKRQKLLEKNGEIETEEEQDQDQGDGINEWREYLVYNKPSVIVDTFQGQFKSIITCFGCKRVSVTYEPFMYLALPLPHALEKQLIVTVVNCSNYSYGRRDVEGGKPTKYLAKVHKYDQVSKIAEVLNETFLKDGLLSTGETLKMHLAEVQDNYVYKTLENQSLMRDIDDKNRSIYAFAMCSSSKTSVPAEDEKQTELQPPFIGPVLPPRIPSCVICLEEKSSTDLIIHDAACNCTVCYQCFDKLVDHYCKESSTFACPNCFNQLSKNDFFPLDANVKENVLTIRSLIVPLVYRIEQLGFATKYRLVSHPLVVEILNVVSGAQLYEMVDRLVPYAYPYSLHFVDRTGQLCSRCYWGSSCSGCEISRFGEVVLNYDDCIAVQFDSAFSSENYTPEVVSEHKSVLEAKPSLSTVSQSLQLSDCLSAFSETEMLDDDNPWFCPTCDSNQRARKSLSIWRAPDTLMVYLKRFVFHQMQSVKVDEPVIFPIDKLDMTPFVKGPSSDLVYELQSFVCHSGGVNSGHYTSFSRHCTTGDWYYFNDDTVTKQDPDPNDDRAYILFYQRPKGNYTMKTTEKNVDSMVKQDCQSMVISGEKEKGELPMSCD